MADTARLTSVNNINDAGLVNEEDIVTKNPDRNSETRDFPVNATSVLTLFTEKYPEIVPTLRTTKDHYHALKEAQNDGNLISLAAFQHVKGLYDVYIQDKSPKNRRALTEFAVALGIPKFAYEVIVDSRTKYQDLTTWDREKDAEGSKADPGVRAEEQVSSLRNCTLIDEQCCRKALILLYIVHSMISLKKLTPTSYCMNIQLNRCETWT